LLFRRHLVILDKKKTAFGVLLVLLKKSWNPFLL